MPPSASSIAPLWSENRQARLLNWPPPVRVVGISAKNCYSCNEGHACRLTNGVQSADWAVGSSAVGSATGLLGGDLGNIARVAMGKIDWPRNDRAALAEAVRHARHRSRASHQETSSASRFAMLRLAKSVEQRGRSGPRYRQALRTGGARMVHITVRQPERHCTKSALRNRSPREKPGLGPGRARPAVCPHS